MKQRWIAPQNAPEGYHWELVSNQEPEAKKEIENMINPMQIIGPVINPNIQTNDSKQIASTDTPVEHAPVFVRAVPVDTDGDIVYPYNEAQKHNAEIHHIDEDKLADIVGRILGFTD